MTPLGQVRLAGEGGLALVMAMLCALLLAALGAVLVSLTSSETMIADNYRSSVEAAYAAEAILERALDDLQRISDWSQVLSGELPSGFVDGAPSGRRVLADGSAIDLGQILNVVDCGKPSACSGADMDAVTAARPWGPNNPRWRLYAYGRIADLLSDGTINSPYYAVVFAGDDGAENDGDPLVDGSSAGNPGSGVIALRAEAFGPRHAHKVIEATLATTGVGGIVFGASQQEGDGAGSAAVRVLSWREVR